MYLYFVFFNDTATTEIYTLSLHDALPIWLAPGMTFWSMTMPFWVLSLSTSAVTSFGGTTASLSPCTIRPEDGQRSEEHTSELQSRLHLVCRLLLEKKKQRRNDCHRAVVLV